MAYASDLSSENLPFVEELYRRYLEDPSQVDAEWQAVLAPLAREQRGAPTRPALTPRSIFAAGGTPGHGAAAAPLTSPRALDLQARLDDLIHAFRVSGHTVANLDPLGREPARREDLEPAHHGIGPQELDTACTLPHMGQLTVSQAVEHMRATYCRQVGVQFMHIDDAEAREWLQARMEATRNSASLTREERLRILDRLTRAETFEQFVHTKFLGAKRFSLEGGESLIPLLDLAVERATEHGVEEVVIGMAHRGRLNVLVNVIGKAAGDIFREFEDKDPQLYFGRGDVKYHLGHQSEVTTAGGRRALLTLCFNPSHLEFVAPVVLGRVRARQDQRGDLERRRVLPLVIHGDAAFAGQGIVQETLNMGELAGYTTGGALHVIVNNQIGFTTPPEKARSTRYATDVARMLQVPVFHVNGEHPESVAYVARLALDFRERFKKDVIIDLYCYRRYGHNEGDEPAFTQPLMYEVIRNRPGVREVYVEQLAQGGIERGEAEALMQRCLAGWEAELQRARGEGYTRAPARITNRWRLYKGGRDEHAAEVTTAVPRERLSELLLKSLEVPEDFQPHPKLARVLEPRREMAQGARALDWAAGEILAFASLLGEGRAVRLSGQDSGRGTFSHRHAVFYDARDGRSHVPLCHLQEGQARFEVWDSPLSEQGVLGFEYGFSVDSPDALVLWEAQFGDFCNAAQVIIDQFLTSAEDKWNLLCGLVLLLPHGFEGQGPEHSSARLERFLQMCAEDNIQVVNLTTPAQLFHCLRRQVLRTWRKPLVVMSPKSLLRHKDAVSSLEELAEGGFQRLIPDPRPAEGVRRVLLCSGKVYYDLAEYRAAHERQDVAILRLEQLYPLPEAELVAALADYADGTPVSWVQEEPWNMGAWYYLRAHLSDAPAGGGAGAASRALARFPFGCVSRDASASPATGSAGAHRLEQELLVKRAFGDA